MLTNRQAMVAFAELLFCCGMEGHAMLRRWPYRVPRMGVWEPRDCLSDPEVDLSFAAQQHWISEAKTWILRQVAASSVMHAWWRAQQAAIAAVNSGVANWSSAAERFDKVADDGPLERRQWKWHTAPPPLQATWAVAVVGDRLRWASAPAIQRIDWTLAARSKAARRTTWTHAQAARRVVLDGCLRGPTLSWSKHFGWEVGDAADPDSTDVRCHELFMPGGARLPIWLYLSQGRFWARARERRIQASGNTPREAFAALREAIGAHARRFGNPPCERKPRSVLPEKCRADLDLAFKAQILQCKYQQGFWRGAWTLNDLVRRHLDQDRQLEVHQRAKVEIWL